MTALSALARPSSLHVTFPLLYFPSALVFAMHTLAHFPSPQPQSHPPRLCRPFPCSLGLTIGSAEFSKEGERAKRNRQWRIYRREQSAGDEYENYRGWMAVAGDSVVSHRDYAGLHLQAASFSTSARTHPLLMSARIRQCQHNAMPPRACTTAALCDREPVSLQSHVTAKLCHC